MSFTQRFTGISLGFVIATILIGGIVHATGSSLGCPDWPLCFGQWFPAMEGAVLYEHSHRIVAGLSFLLIYSTAVASWIESDRTNRNHRWILYGTALAVTVQAVLGGLTVLYRLPTWISTTHFVLGLTTMGLLLVVYWGMNQQFRERPGLEVRPGDRWLSAGIFLVVCVQMLLGGLTRHMGSPAPLTSPDRTRMGWLSVPCKDYPICDPVWVEYMTDSFLTMYWTHRIFAIVVVGMISWGVWRFRNYRRERPRVFHLLLIASAMVVVQMMLGVFTVRSYLEPVSVTLHYAGGMILLISGLVLMLESFRPEWLINET